MASLLFESVLILPRNAIFKRFAYNELKLWVAKSLIDRLGFSEL